MIPCLSLLSTWIIGMYHHPCRIKGPEEKTFWSWLWDEGQELEIPPIPDNRIPPIPDHRIPPIPEHKIPPIHGLALRSDQRIPISKLAPRSGHKNSPIPGHPGKKALSCSQKPYINSAFCSVLLLVWAEADTLLVFSLPINLLCAVCCVVWHCGTP